MAVVKKRGQGPLHMLWPFLFFLGLAAVLLGERILVGFPTLAVITSGLGVALVLTSTIARLGQSNGPTARDKIARLLGGSQALGVVGLAVYWALTLWLADSLDESPTLHDAFSVLWVSLLSVSVAAVLFGEWSLHSMRQAEHVESTRVRFAVTSGAVIALAVGYGALFVYAAAKQETKADFSYFKTSRAGEPTLRLVEQLGDKVTVTGFFPEVSEVREEVAAYFAQLTAHNPALQVRLVDRYLEPKLASELKVVRDGVVVFTRDDNRQTISVGTEIAKARSKLRTLDEEVHSRLMKLLREKKLAYMTTGHGELNDKAATGTEGRKGDIFRKVIEQGNIRVQELGLGEGLGREVPSDADLLIILGPTTPFAPEELAAVRRYAARGGKIFMALDADVRGDMLVSPSDPGPETSTADPEGKPGVEQATVDKRSSEQQWLVQLAETVGAVFVPSVLADEESFVVRQNNASDRVILPTNRFSSHASVSTLSRNPTRGVVVLGAAHLNKEAGNDARTDVAVRTLGSAFHDADGDFEHDPGEKKQEYVLAVAITQPVSGAAPSQPASDTAEAAVSEMRAFVLADADAMSDLLMPRVPGNPLLAFDAVRWLVGEESLAGEIESEEDVRVEQSKQVNMAWFYSTVFGVPTLVLLGGVVMSRRGRRRANTKPPSTSRRDGPLAEADKAERQQDEEGRNA